MRLIVGCVAVMAAAHGIAQPVARDNFYSVAAATPLSVAAPGVLANDVGTGLQFALVSSATGGLLLTDISGAFFYIPRAGFSGNDSFTYQARQGTALSNIATVTISVLPPGGGNVPPVAAADSYVTAEDEPLNVPAGTGVLANDFDANTNALTAALVAGPVAGTLALQADGSFSYTPPAGFGGTVTFTYQASDGTASSNAATVTITVNAVNDAPAAPADSYTTAEDTPLNVAAPGVLGNDSDPENDPLTAQLERNVANGTLQLNPNGSFAYTPSANFNGPTTFTYRARDASLGSAPATVTINVTPVNDAPFITTSPPTSATEGVTYRYTLGVSDPDGTTPIVSATRLPSWLTFAAPATISGTPADADVGTHTVAMSVSDGTAPPVTTEFQITVQGVDSPPAVRTIPEQTATENTPFDFDLARFVTDSDTAAASLSYAATDALPAGLTLSAAGRLSGTPQIGASVGAHTVRFTVKDAENTVPGQFRLVVLAAGRVDLEVTMRASPNPATLDTPTSWSFTVTNRAPQVEATGATLEASFAGEVPFIFDALPPSSGCTLAPSGPQTNIVCSIGRLPGSASSTVTLTGRGSVAGDVFATARVKVAGTGTLDETPANDTTSASLSFAHRVAGAPAQSIALAGGRAAAAADFNADGFDELVVATASPQGVVLFTSVTDPANAGRRTFATPPQALGGEALANDVAIVDLDRDGDLDIVTAAGRGAPDRAFLNSSGTFTSTALGNDAVESRAVATGDINGDGFVDLVFASAGTSTVLMNTGSGATFSAGAGVGPHDARDVLLVDLFGDTLPELVLANADGGATVYRNTAGAFRLETTLATGATSAVSAGEFNADARNDLVFARDTATLPAVPSAAVFLNTSAASGQMFLSDELGAAKTTGVLIRDVNLDGRSDVLAVNGNGVRIFTDAGAANGTFALYQQQLAIPGARGLTAGKFSNDDRVDLAVVGDTVAVFINDGAGNFGEPDFTPPVIQLRGERTVNIMVDEPYTDAGATATDQQDGDVTSRIVVKNPVDTKVVGTYAVTYSVSDLSGNSATPVTRTVNVQAQQGAGGGGGGAMGLGALAALLLAAALRKRGQIYFIRPVSGARAEL